LVEGLEAGGVDYVTKRWRTRGAYWRRIRGCSLTNARMGAKRAHGTRCGSAVSCLQSTAPQSAVVHAASGELLAATLHDFTAEDYIVPAAIHDWLADAAAATAVSPPSPIELTSRASSKTAIAASMSAKSDRTKHLLRVIEGDVGNDQMVLKSRLMITDRESEVLLWIARGKSNRDIGRKS